MECVRHALFLKEGTVLRVHDGCGVSIRVAAGAAWITQEGDCHDVIVRAGATWCIERDGATLVQALTPTRLAFIAERSRERPDTRATFSFLQLSDARGAAA
jgi:hypothetical protein